ncbi:MAG: DUF5110 domain-containing protein, partial [Lentisphaeria bacterium]|nr:DUF5110 domain-containing protein [Lentisphaeria bacterium]
DPQVRDILFQYMLGRDLMVCAFRPEVYFPAGRWKDVWTGEVIEGGCRTTISWGGVHGGGLYLREGGIITLGPTMQYRGEKPLDEIEVHVFPGPAPSTLAFYEDDGVSLAHREGTFATTELGTVREADGTVRVWIGETKGDFPGRFAERLWSVAVALDGEPAAVSLDGQSLGRDEWSYDPSRRELLVVPMPGPAQFRISF